MQRVRRTSRILILDDSGAILLLKTHWGRRSLPPRWLTPGGGIDPGEDVHTAAVRELFEETGLRVDSLGEPVAFRRIPLPPAEEYQVREATYFVLRTPRFDPVPDDWTESEHDDIVGIRWFAPDELAASTEEFDPEDVRGVLAELRDAGGVRVRRATGADAAELARIATVAYGGYLPRMPRGMRPGPMDDDYAAAIERAEVWVAEETGRVVGYVVLVAASDHVLLENLAVVPDAQGRGVGRRLLALAEERGRAHRVDTIRLFTHITMVENQRLYARQGYVETSRTNEGGVERVFFEKRL